MNGLRVVILAEAVEKSKKAISGLHGKKNFEITDCAS